MKTIALANQKGGVGKTTTAASLGIGLSRQGKKVLLIDADAQGNLTQMLGWPQPDELSPTLSTLMEKIIAEQPIAPGEGILHHSSGVHLVPANIELSALEVTLVNTMSRETVLRQYLSTVADRYDYALIDCMPSLGMLTINALTAADSVIIPVQAQYLPAKGLEQLLRTITRVKRQLNPKLEVDGMKKAARRAFSHRHWRSTTSTRATRSWIRIWWRSQKLRVGCKFWHRNIMPSLTLMPKVTTLCIGDYPLTTRTGSALCWMASPTRNAVSPPSQASCGSAKCSSHRMKSTSSS